MSIVKSAKQVVQGAIQGAMAKAVALAPDSWIPGGESDPLIRHQHGHIGKPLSRIDGPLKVAGQARFAAEFPIEGMVYAALVHSTIAKGKIVRIDTANAEAADGVVAVMTHENAPRLKPPPVFMSAAKAARRRQLAGDARCDRTLERRAGRGGARGNRGAGGARGIAGCRAL